MSVSLLYRSLILLIFSFVSFHFFYLPSSLSPLHLSNLILLKFCNPPTVLFNFFAFYFSIYLSFLSSLTINPLTLLSSFLFLISLSMYTLSLQTIFSLWYFHIPLCSFDSFLTCLFRTQSSSNSSCFLCS